jgi:hypothetical protein
VFVCGGSTTNFEIVDRETGTVVVSEYVSPISISDEEVRYTRVEEFVRPTSGDAFLVYSSDPSGGVDWDEENLDYKVIEYDFSGTDVTHRVRGSIAVNVDMDEFIPWKTGDGLIHCNNAVSRPLERVSDSHEVALGYGGVTNQPAHPTQVDLAVTGPNRRIDEKRGLAPLLPPEDEGDHPWRLAVDPAAASKSLESVADDQRERIADVLSMTDTTQEIYLEEANYFLPLLVARPG